MPRNVNVCFISSYPPRKCGIATFTSSLAKALLEFTGRGSLSVLAVEDHGIYEYGSEVKLRVRKDILESYSKAAKYINKSRVDVVHLQHEFGLFGGDWGEYILELLERVDKPIVTTFHTVLPNPNPKVWRTVRDISQLSSSIIVMAKTGINILARDYNIPRSRLSFIPHGCPDVPLAPSAAFKKALGFEDRVIVSTYGLLSRNKGVEYAIEALPQLVEEEPRILYIVAGETHPEVKRSKGETYRIMLMNLVRKLNVEKHIVFYDRYLNDKELIQLLQATDIYLTPYINRNQITSGTLTYAMGVGKTIVSTPYLYAVEMLRDMRGLLCEFRNPESISSSVEKILTDTSLRRTMEVKNYEYTRKMIWPLVAKKHLNLYRKLSEGEEGSLEKDQSI